MAHWQRRLRYAVALFVVVFAAVVAVSFRKGHLRQPAPAVPKGDPNAVLYTQGGGSYTGRKDGKASYSIKFGTQATYPDNRSKFGGGVTVVLPEKTGRQITIQSQEAEVTNPPGHEVGTAVFSGGVKLTTSDGITVTAPTATYNDEDQVTRIPGPMTFAKGRMSGSGVGATYDQQRNVLWIIDQAKVDVAADPKGGSGAVHITSKSAGMARAEHYMKFLGGSHMDAEAHVIDADASTAYLTPDDERVTRMELRGNSSIVGKPGGSGPQDMRAKDIDLAYAEDGRTLQSAHMVENASIQLPGEKGKAARRISGKGIDVALAPDGSTVTNLTANERVQVDLPPDGDLPSRRIRSASLIATGAPGQGIQAATFTADVEYRESRAARGKLAAIDRTARSQRLDVKTKPGFGDIEQADFHTNVHFTDGTQTTADAPMAVYSIAQDRLDLSPGEGDIGAGPHVSDGRVSVDARTIQMTLGTQVMRAETNVRSVMQQSKKDAKPDTPAVKMPSMLKQDQPVNVKSNRLDYDGAKSIATYEGNSRLWQDDTVIQADRIVLEDSTGNLHATTKVVTVMTITEAEDKSAPAKGPKKPPEPTNTTADELLYEDGKHKATYTGTVHMSGPSGDVTADRMELFLAEQGGQLERAEADGNVVSRQEARRAYGRHLTYNAKTDEYTMIGTPVKIYEDTSPDCKVSEGAMATFRRTGSTMTVSGSAAAPHKSYSVPCGSNPGSH